jgi:hypothetical protein
LAKDAAFLELLETCAAEAQTSVGTLTGILRGKLGMESLDVFLASERRERKLLKEIDERLVRTFVTELEREDIEALSRALYRLVKAMEKFAERYRVVNDLVQGVDFKEQGRLIDEAVRLSVEMIRHLRKMPPLETVKALNDKLEETEDAADRVLEDLIRDLYHDDLPAGKLVARKDLYDILEKLVDRSRDIGAIVTHIVLKNS